MTRAPAAFGLTARLVLLVVGAALAVALFLWFYVRPHAGDLVVRSTGPLIARSTEAMRGSAREAARVSAETLTTLIEHTSNTRRATLKDLPLDLYDGDPARIQAAIDRQDGALSRRLVENVGRLAAEMDVRAQQRIDIEAEALATQQRALAGDVAADMQRGSLWLLGGVMSALLVLLALAMHRLVVQPVRALQLAADSVAQGRLEVALHARGDDEVARLTRAFATMIDELRASRAEVDSKRAQLTQLNTQLEAEVSRKTAALQQALDGLQAAQKDLVLAERMASVGTLAGGIAHEFNNLAGGIRGCAREMLAREDDAARREPLEVIVRAAERAIDVTDKLLRFARPRPPGSMNVDLDKLLHEAMALLEPQARQQNVRTRLESAADLSVRGDSGALHQVIVNLLTNALHAMPTGGELLVSARAHGDEAVVTVRDTGVGIAAADLDRIFDPFFTTRGHEAATPGRGAGLGLAVSYGIVQAHGGRMQVDSVRGEGATFTVRLPQISANRAAPGEPGLS